MTEERENRFVLATAVTIVVAIAGAIYTHFSVISDLRSRVAVLERTWVIQMEHLSNSVHDIKSSIQDVKRKVDILTEKSGRH